MHTSQPGKFEGTLVDGSDPPHQASAYRTGATVAVASPGEGEDRLEVNRKVGESGLGRLEYLGGIDVVVLVDDAVAQARRGGDLGGEDGLEDPHLPGLGAAFVIAPGRGTGGSCDEVG